MKEATNNNPKDLAYAIDLIAHATGWAAAEIALVLEYLGDSLEGDRVAKSIAECKRAKSSGWVALNLYNGRITEVRLNPEVHGGVVTNPESRNPFKNYLRDHYSHNHKKH